MSENHNKCFYSCNIIIFEYIIIIIIIARHEKWFTLGFQEHGNTTWGSNMLTLSNTPSYVHKSLKSDEILYTAQLNST